MRYWIIAGLLLAGCTGGGDTYRLGAAGPWTERYGAMNRRGIELALQQINSRGGVRGRKLEIVMRDDEGSGEKAARIAGEFVRDPSIVAVVGHVNSGAMVSAAKVYDGNMPAVATTATSPDLTGISGWVFRVISSDSTNGEDLARFSGSLGHRRAAILYENNPYGRGLTRSFERNFAGEVISADPISEDGMQNFEPFVAYLKIMRPDVVFVAGTEQSGLALLREARRQGLSSDFMGGDGWTGVVTDTAASEGVYVGAPFSAADTRASARQFVSAFRAKYGMVPDGNAALGYDATMLLAKALEAGGADRESVRNWLAGLTAQSAHRGVTGPIRFGAGGDPVGKGFVMTQLQGGVLVVQGEVP
ncbi:MAG TPA: ABC transporter substrate-binding protein [Gemmatimonadaceae bacterium]|nr:ABC transporter substrate-binding protein [Gemmatimonadaceae bacterium]